MISTSWMGICVYMIFKIDFIVSNVLCVVYQKIEKSCLGLDCLSVCLSVCLWGFLFPS